MTPKVPQASTRQARRQPLRPLTHPLPSPRLSPLARPRRSQEELPAQLLFVHAGQTDIKELHWHAQIPGMIGSTAADGFNLFRPSNL